MLVSLIVAVAENGVIGREGRMPWHLPADLRHFKQTTMGHHLIVGRKTWEAIGRPLPGRTMIVVSRQPGFVAAGAVVVASPDEALRRAREAGESEAFVAGGGEIYRALLPAADRVYLTRVAAAPAGDAFFPDLDPAEWRQATDEPWPADERNPFGMRFQLYEKVML